MRLRLMPKGGGGDAGAAAAAAPPVKETYKADYSPGSHVMCRSCFAVILGGEVRITCEVPKASYYHLAKQYFHLRCSPPKCDEAEVIGLAKLQQGDRDKVVALMHKVRREAEEKDRAAAAAAAGGQ